MTSVRAYRSSSCNHVAMATSAFGDVLQRSCTCVNVTTTTKQQNIVGCIGGVKYDIYSGLPFVQLIVQLIVQLLVQLI